MKNLRILFILVFGTFLICSLNSCKKWSETEMDSIRIVTNKNGQKLGYSVTSGISLLFDKGYAFKDLNKNGILDRYEDWRLSASERAEDLASQMTIEQIAGLMLYSAHQGVPNTRDGQTYGGRAWDESGAYPYDLTDQQIVFLRDDNLRHVLVTSVESPEVAARWNNNAQALVEGLGLGIPCNNSSDPRHRTTADAEYNEGSGGQISMWPGSLGMAATFDPQLVRRFGEIASVEYRALGIATALSPQIDLATEPRWNRVTGTFGEDPQLAADMARAYVDGFQTSSPEKEISESWGYESVNAMVKHWPSGGPEEGGRDAHYNYGKYTVYPGDNFQEQLIPFVEGAFKLEGETGMAAAVMPYYTISYNQDTEYGENVGNSYSRFMINDLLRTKYNFDGVVCTDWGITGIGGRAWGLEDNTTVAERHYRIIMAGVDQFGGNNDAGPVIEAYNMGVAEHSEDFMRDRFEQTAVRLLKNMFRTGLFENPYLDVEETNNTVGKAEFMAAGYEAQLKSIIMLKNKENTLPLEKNIAVYIPKRYSPATTDRSGNAIPESYEYPVNIDIVEKYFSVTVDPDEADAAIVFISGPNTGNGYSEADLKAGGNGYVPISLQYKPYLAVYARDPSIAGDPRPTDVLNRTYRGKSVAASNVGDLQMVIDARAAMNEKPVIVVVAMSRPIVFSEFEQETDAIIAGYGVQDQAIMDILSGEFEPSGLLPMQMPSSMRTVEEQFEDVPHDMECYVDSEGNTYDFGFGMNWNGVIMDERTAKYKK
ncbi:MAG: glycoside hydrolase family 3 C-terminal domain-containing protein [Bacteroidales bacterium]|nr:glycoside hydrolase family 3 C-terminal domain-containing protein [Bacteroidales bacterium]